MTAARAYSHLTSRGLPAHIAAGIVGNIQVESGFDDEVITGRRLGDNGSAFGAFQHRADRVKNLVSFAQENSLDPQKLETQLDFAISEMTTGSDVGAKRALGEMLQTNDAGEAARIFMQHFERPNANPQINKVDQRMTFAASVLAENSQPQSPSINFKERLSQFRQQRGSTTAKIPESNRRGFAEKLKQLRANRQQGNQLPALPPNTPQPLSPQFRSTTSALANDNLSDIPHSELLEIGDVITRTSKDFSRLQNESREEFNSRNSKLLRLQAKIGLSRDDVDVIEQIKSVYPDAKFTQDKDGNNIAQFDGLTAILNKPGISTLDVSRFGRDAAVIGVPAALTGGLGGAVGGLAGRLVGSGLGSSTGSVATDLISGLADGTGDIRPVNAAIAGAAGIGGEALASILGRFGPSVISRVRDLLGRGEVVKNGTLTPAARQALQKAGIPEEEITDELMHNLARINTGDEISAARVADASSLPIRVPLTTGQATQNPATAGIESSAKKGAFGEPLAAYGLAKQEMQQSALNENARIIRSQIAGSNPIEHRGTGVAAAQAELVNSRSMAKLENSAQFEIAKQGNAAVSANAVAGFRNSLSRAMRADFDIEGLPIVSRLLTQLRTPAYTKSVNLGALENWRRRVSGAQRSAAKGTQSTSATEATALGRMLAEYDTAIQTSLSNAVVKGTVEDITAWREAIRGRKAFADRFESVPVINKLTETARQGGERVLKVDPADAAAEILGRAQLGLKKGLTRDLRHLQRELSPQGWNSIRDEATLQLFSAADGTFKAGSEFARRLDILQRDAPTAFQALFTREERALLNRLSRVSKLVERPPRVVADANPSGTAAMNAIINKARMVGGPIGEFVTAFGASFFRKTAQSIKVAEASRYFAGVLERRTVQLPTAFKATGIAAANTGLGN